MALAASSGVQLASPLVLRRAIDGLSRPGGASRLLGDALLFAALAALQALFKFVSRRQFLGEARGVEYDLRRTYFGHLLRLPLERIEASRKGDLVSRAVNDLQDVRLFLGPGTLNFLQTFVLLAAGAAFLWHLHAKLALAALVPFPIVTLVVGWASPLLHRRYLEANRRSGDLTAVVQEGIAALRVVRSFRRETWLGERFEGANRRVREAEASVARLSGALFPGVSFVAGLGQVVVLGVGGALVARGELTLGSFVAFNAYLTLLTWPMVALGWTLGLVQRGAAAFSRLREVLAWSVDPDGADPLPPPTGVCLEARDVSFGYPGAPARVLDGLTLTVAEGEFRGLVGATGSGKSTAVALLARLRRPDCGMVLAHGAGEGALASASLRDHVAVVPQGGTLFSETVAINVTLGRVAEPARVAEVLDAAGLSEELAAFPRGVETLVGEGGITLSGGQRQRLAIARALYGRPGCLVLDSAFSHLDADTARRVLAAVRRFAPGMTLLVVSHRGADLEDADGVSFLAGGRIVAEGRHCDLLARLSAYRRLYREETLRRELGEQGG